MLLSEIACAKGIDWGTLRTVAENLCHTTARDVKWVRVVSEDYWPDELLGALLDAYDRQGPGLKKKIETPEQKAYREQREKEYDALREIAKRNLELRNRAKSKGTYRKFDLDA